jgi:hypothetical protein
MRNFLSRLLDKFQGAGLALKIKSPKTFGWRAITLAARRGGGPNT